MRRAAPGAPGKQGVRGQGAAAPAQRRRACKKCLRGVRCGADGGGLPGRRGAGASRTFMWMVMEKMEWERLERLLSSVAAVRRLAVPRSRTW